MKCKWTDCENGARAKSPFCSGTCKKRYQRASGTDVPVEVGQEQVGQLSGTGPKITPKQYANCLRHGEGSYLLASENLDEFPVCTIAHYYANPSKYIQRREPDKLNWGPWMNMAELEQAGLKANRVSVPGDWDYAGTAQPTGAWT